MEHQKTEIIFWFYAMVIAALAQLAPIVPLMATVGLLIFVDTTFGIWAAIKRNEQITSKGLSRLIAKMFVYQTTVCTFFYIETHIMADFLPLTKLVATCIVLVESISVLENAGIILSKPIFKILIEKLSSKSTKFGGGK